MSHKWFCLACYPCCSSPLGCCCQPILPWRPPWRLRSCNVPSLAMTTIGAALADPTCAVINVASGLFQENLVIDRDVMIAGAGAAQTIINGGALDRVILITDTATVTITDVIITNGLIVTGAEP